MSQTFKGLYNSKEFKALPYSGRVAAANDYWDRLKKESPPELAGEIELHRDIIVGGMEAHGRAAGLTGNGTFTENSKEISQSFDKLYGMIDSGIHRSDPEVFAQAGEQHSAIIKRQAEELQLGASAYESQRKNSQLRLQSLNQALNVGGGTAVGQAVTVVNSAKDKEVYKKDGLWTAPSTLRGSKGEAPGVVDSAVQLTLNKLGVLDRQTEGRSSSTQTAADVEFGGLAPKPKNPLELSPTIADVMRSLEDSGIPEDQVKSTWTDFINVKRKWEPGEMTRVQSSGEILLNTQDTTIITDLDKVRKAIMNTATSDFARQEALNSLEAKRSQTAEANAANLYMLSALPGGLKEDLLDTVIREIGHKPFADIISDYLGRNEISGSQKAFISARKGLAKITQTAAGGLGFLGSDKAAKMAADLDEANQLINAGIDASSQESGFMGKSFQMILEEAPSLALQMLATGGTSRAATGLGRLAGLGGQSVTRAASATATTGMIGGSAAQSGALTFAEEVNKNIKAGDNIDEAKAKARVKAAKAGITTGLITTIFGVGSFGGVEGAAHSITMSQLRMEAAKRGVPFAQLASKEIRERTGGAVTGIFGEMGEEGFDNFLNKFVNADGNESVADAWTEAWEGAKGGAILAGTMQGFRVAQTAKELAAVSIQEADTKKRIDADKAKIAADFEAATVQMHLETYAPDSDFELTDLGEEIGIESPTKFMEDSRAAQEIWTNDNGDVVGMFDLGGVKTPRLYKNGEWLTIEKPAGRDLTLNAFRNDLATQGFYPRMQSRAVKQIDKEGKPFDSIEEATDAMLAADVDPGEYEIVSKDGGFVGQEITGTVKYTKEEGKASAQQELDARAYRVAQVQAREDARTQRAINDAQAPLTGSSLEQAKDLKRAADKVSKPKFPAAKDTLKDKAGAEEAENAQKAVIAGHPIDPAAYKSDHEKAAAEVLNNAGITTMADAVAYANSNALAEAEGTFPDLLRSSLNVVLNSDVTRNIGNNPQAPDPKNEVFGETDREKVRAGIKADLKEGKARREAFSAGEAFDALDAGDPQAIGNLDAAIKKAIDQIANQTADPNQQVYTMEDITPPVVAEEAIAEAAAEPVATPPTDQAATPDAETGINKVGVSTDTAGNVNAEITKEEGEVVAVTFRGGADAVKGDIAAVVKQSVRGVDSGAEPKRVRVTKLKSGDLSLTYSLDGDKVKKTFKQGKENSTGDTVFRSDDRLLSQDINSVASEEELKTTPTDSQTDTDVGELAPQESSSAVNPAPGVTPQPDTLGDATDIDNDGVGADASKQDRGVADGGVDTDTVVSSEAIEAARQSGTAEDFSLQMENVEKQTNTKARAGEISGSQMLDVEAELAKVPPGDWKGLAKVQEKLNQYSEPSVNGTQDLVDDNTVDGEKDFNKAYSPDSNRNPGQDAPQTTSKAIRALIEQMTLNFNVKFEWVDRLPKNAFGKYNREANAVTLSRAVPLEADTPIHEIGHAFLAAVRAQNPKLYNNLLRQTTKAMESDNQLKQIRAAVIRDYPRETERVIMEEVMATYLGENGAASIKPDQAWRDQSNPESKGVIAKIWSAIRDMFRRIMPGIDKKTLADIGPNTRMRDIATMLVDPRTKFDLSETLSPKATSSAVMLNEHARGVGMVSDFLMRTIEDGKGAVKIGRQAGRAGFYLITGDWKPLQDRLSKAGKLIADSFTDSQLETLRARLAAHTDSVLGQEFWSGLEPQRIRIGQVTKLGPDITARELSFVMSELADPEFIARMRSGEMPPADYERMTRIGRVTGVNPTFSKPSTIFVPEAGATAMRGVLGKNAGIATALESDATMTALTADEITDLKKSIKTRKGMANDMVRFATDPTTDPLLSGKLLRDMNENEAAAASNLDVVRPNPLAKRGYTRQQYIDGEIPVQDQTWADREMREYSATKVTGEMLEAHARIIAEADGGLYQRKEADSTNPDPPKKNTRFGDGSREGLYTAIADRTDLDPPNGPGKMMPTADGSRPKPFNKFAHALSFRAKSAAREGFRGTELRIVKDEKEGVVTYHVVVPDNENRAGMARLGMMADPAQYFEALKDPVKFPALPTFDEVQNYLEGGPIGFRRTFKKMVAKLTGSKKDRGNSVPEDSYGDNSNGGMDMDRMIDVVDRAIMVNKYQQTWSRMVAANKMKAMKSLHAGAFTTEADGLSANAGKVTNLNVPEGKSEYLSDILEEAMVDTTGYDFSPDQLAMIEDFRAMMEHMRQQMRNAKLDKKFLAEHGLDTGAFLDDPKAGDDSWRRYFPRMVVGTVGPKGFKEKQFIGVGSSNTEQKGYEKKRITKTVDGKEVQKSMEEIKSDPKTADIVYSDDPFEAIEHFLTNSYSAISANDLATNLVRLEVDGDESSRKAEYVRGVPVLTQLYDPDIASYLTERLVNDNVESRGKRRLADVVSVSQQIVLGGLDIAAPVTVAGRFTFAHPLNMLTKGSVSGFTDVAKVFAGSIRSDVMPTVMRVITGKIRETTKSESALDRMHAENLTEFSELATLGAMLGRGTDYQEQADRLRSISELKAEGEKGELSTKRALSSLKRRAVEWGAGLGDFHRNYSEYGKMLMWKSIRGKFIDPATGNLRYDQDSVTRMMKEVRSLDRSFGYSNDLSLSSFSRSQKGWMRILLTAPTMYYSMTKNLTSINGAVHTANYALAGMVWFVAMAQGTDMTEEEIYSAMMNPAKPGFMTLNIRTPSSTEENPQYFRLSFANFYKSLAVMAGKQVDVGRKVVQGKPITKEDLLNPVSSFTRSRRSPFISGITGLITDKDFLGREYKAAAAVTDMWMPLSINEPLRVWAGRVLKTNQLSTAEEHWSITEKRTMADSAMVLFASVMGSNIYNEPERAAITRDRNRLFQEKFGKDFKDASLDELQAAVDIAKQVQGDRGSPPSFGGFDPAYGNIIKRRYIKMFRPELQYFINLSGVVKDITVPGAIRTAPGDDQVIIYLPGDSTLGMSVQKAGAEWATTREGGLNALLERSKRERIPPAAMQDEIKWIINDSARATNEEVKSRDNIR